MTTFIKPIFDALRWIISLPWSKMIVVILLIFNGVQFKVNSEKDEIIKKKDLAIQSLNVKVSELSEQNGKTDKWWALRSDSLVAVEKLKHEDLLMKIIRDLETGTKEQKRTEKIIKETDKNISKIK